MKWKILALFIVLGAGLLFAYEISKPWWGEIRGCSGYNTGETLFKGKLVSFEVIGWEDYGGKKCNMVFTGIETVKGASEQYRGYYGVYIGNWEQNIIEGEQYIVSEVHTSSGHLIRSLIDWDEGANMKELWDKQ